MKKPILLILLLLLLTVSTASASEYYVISQIETVQNTGGGVAWSTPITFNLNKSESFVTPSVTINYFDLGNSNSVVLYRITGGSLSDAVLGKAQSICIKGTCTLDNTSTGAIRLTTNDIIEKTSPIINTTNSDNIVDVYVQCSTGEKLSLDKDGENKYEPSTCNTKTGWSTSVNKELTLYIHRNLNIPVAITITTNGGYKEEGVDLYTKKYTLQSNDKYAFSVKTTRKDSWGGDIEETKTYTIIISGLSTANPSSAINQVLFPAPYEVISGSTMTLTLPPGDFEANPAFTAANMRTTEDNKVRWDLTFNSIGTITAKYNIKPSGSASGTFVIKENSAEASETITANQETSDNAESGDNKTMLIIVSIILIAIAVFLFMRNRKANPRRERREQTTSRT